MKIAMIGTRGVPAAYGGFETAVEEIGSRLAEAGHEVVVYCRHATRPRKREYRGMRLVHLGSLPVKSADTLSHTALSVAHVVSHRRPDAAFVFNAANAPFVPLLRARGIPTAVHVDGLEWKRDKWGHRARRYYRWAEAYAVRHADALIADAQGIADYYRDEFQVPTELLTYGAKIIEDAPTDRIAALGLTPGQFHVAVARFEPENHVDVIVDGYRESRAKHPLVVVGGAPYAADYVERITRSAAADDRIRLLGSIYDQETLDQLYSHAATYLHGHSVGGTNPSLLRAMGAGTAVLAWDVIFNREVAGPAASFFGSARELASAVEHAEDDPSGTAHSGKAMQERAAEVYRWNLVAAGYESLAERLQRGDSIHGTGTAQAALPREADQFSSTTTRSMGK